MAHKILVIVGSTRPGRSGKPVADWFMETAQHEDLEFELVDLAEVDLPFLDEPIPPSAGKYQHEHTKKWAARVASADGYVLVTSEYNHGYPAPLKNALDYVYAEWHKKPFSFVSYGGAGGARAVEQLTQVVRELQAAPLRNGLMVPNVWDAIDENGNLDGEAVNGDMDVMLDELAWWAKALADARQQ